MKIDVYLFLFKCSFVIITRFNLIDSVTSNKFIKAYIIKGDDIFIGEKWAEQLRFDLLKDYDVMAEPIPENETYLTIGVGFTIFRTSVDYDTSTVNLLGWISMRWHDRRMAWNATKYGSLKTMNFAFYELWRPQIIIVNRAETTIDNNIYHLTMVEDTGTVIVVPSSNHRVYCDLNLENWPFEEHTCELILRITGTHKASLIFNQSAIDTTDYSVGSDWHLEDMTSQHVTKVCYLCQATLSELHYEFKIKRVEKSYYGFVSLPAIGMSFLLLSIFWLPLMSMKKFWLATLLLITSTMFLIFLSRSVPIFGQEVPKIILFYLYLALLSMIYLIISLILHNVVNSKDLQLKPLPRQVRIFFDHPIIHCLGLSLNQDYSIHQLSEISASLETSEQDVIPFAPTEWFNLAISLNRVAFIVYALIILIMLYNYIM